MKKTGAKLTRKAAVCLLAVPMIVGLSGCAQKSTDTTSTNRQRKHRQRRPVHRSSIMLPSMTSHGRFRANVGTMQNGRTIQVRKY